MANCGFCGKSELFIEWCSHCRKKICKDCRYVINFERPKHGKSTRYFCEKHFRAQMNDSFCKYNNIDSSIDLFERLLKNGHVYYHSNYYDVGGARGKKVIKDLLTIRKNKKEKEIKAQEEARDRLLKMGLEYNKEYKEYVCLNCNHTQYGIKKKRKDFIKMKCNYCEIPFDPQKKQDYFREKKELALKEKKQREREAEEEMKKELALKEKKQREREAEEKRRKDIKQAQKYETALRHSDAILIFEKYEMWDDAGRCRNIIEKKELNKIKASSPKVDIGSIDKSVAITDSVVNRSEVGTESEEKVLICPSCGKNLNFPKPPKFCPYCKEQILN